MVKVFASADEALNDMLFEGMTIMSGAFGLSGNSEHLMAAPVRNHMISAGRPRRSLLTLCFGAGEGPAMALEAP